MKTLLVVDDIETNRLILKKILGDEYKIIESSNGQEALSVLRDSSVRVSAILLDLAMPVMDGFELLGRMRGDSELAQIPVIITTGQSGDKLEVKALQLGAIDYITKPYNSTIIRQRIRNTINLRESAATVNELKRDRLTGLYNRETFFDKVHAMVSAHEPGYYIMACFDIDRFKVINDQYGTEKGDEVLCYIARIFREGFDTHGGICCRIAADDFAVLYPSQFQNSNEIQAVRTQAAHVDGLVAPITFSIGRYVVTDLSVTPSSMYDRAMLAAGSVKGSYDKKIAYYDESMRDHLIHEQEIVTDMIDALGNNQFEVWFQPQYNHSTGAIIGAEALVRWRHPQKGLIPPYQFIPVFEQNGFIYELDKYVWERVCAFLAGETENKHSPLPVSVNISRYDIFCPDVVEVITGLVEKYGIPVSLLRLEITESAFSESTNRIIKVARQLIDYGFTLEIDDFGSGYSSLNTLKSVPAQIVKLDMRFFEDSDDSGRSGNIIESVVRMTKWLGMSVVAEGVEKTNQADYLRSIGCSYIQGYLYAKPMPESDYESLCIGTDKEEKLITMETVVNLDNNSFWDPNSMDTLIFNSYVGGACIFEYYHDAVEMLRVTEKYAQMLGSGMTIEDALQLDWTEYLSKDSKKRFIADIASSIAAKKEVTGEYVFLALPGCPHETYLRSNMRVIASAEDRFLVYCTNENITAQRQSEQRESKISERLQVIMKNIDGGVTATVVKDRKIHLLFANDKHYAQLGYTKEQYEAQFDGIPSRIIEDDRQMVVDRLTEASKTGRRDCITFRVLRTDGKIRWLRSNITIIEYPDVDDPVQLAVANDVTEQIESEQKVRRISDQMQAIMDSVDVGITASINADGAAEFLFANDKYFQMLGYTREQFMTEVNDPYNTIAEDDRERVRREIGRQIKSGVSAILEYRVVRRDGSNPWYRSMISVGRMTGISQPVQLSIYRDITEEKLAEQEIRDTTAQLRTMMDDIPGGFCRIRVVPDGGLKADFINEGLCKLTGMNHSELMAIYSEDALNGVHPDDKAIVRDAVAKILMNGEAHSSRYRLLHKSRGYVWLKIFGRSSQDKNGETFINIYYTDANDEVRQEKLQRELLDNLPYGAALYDLDGDKLSVNHLNKRYWELVERDPADCQKLPALKAVYPDDIAVLTAEINSAVAQKRDISCGVRILCSGGSYRPFRVIGRIVPKSDGRYSIYASYAPISLETMSVQEMLPIALGAMMDRQTDYIFVKDRNLRYVCCSRQFAKLTGYDSAADIIGKTDSELFGKPLADSFTAGDIRVLGSGESITDGVDRLPSKNGAECYACTSKFPLRDSYGNIVGVFGSGRDITESRALKSQFDLLSDSIPGGIATYEYESGQFTVRDFNDGFCRLFGLTRDECVAAAAKDTFIGLFAEDSQALRIQLHQLIIDGIPVDCVYRVHLANGGYKWLNLKASTSETVGSKVLFNAVLFDVTVRQDAAENLRISEEENRLAISHSGNVVCRYDVAKKSLTVSRNANPSFNLPEIITDVPYSQIACGAISPETAEDYRSFYENILNGEKDGRMVYQRSSSSGWRWLEAHSTTIFDGDGKPVSAVISFSDITDQLEKETIYKKWQQSMAEKPRESYTLFRCNLSKDASLDTTEGSLLNVKFDKTVLDFDGRTNEYVEQCVYDEDKDKYTSFLNTDAMLANYYRGKRSASLEFREKQTGGGFRWLKLTVDLVEYPNSTDIEAYLLFENIDEAKRAQLQTIELAETDPLSGLLNRTAFISRVEKCLRTSEKNSRHAFMIIDIDGFKQVNDSFGHVKGDKALVDVAYELRRSLRSTDFVCRLGGDEFLIFLSDIASDSAVLLKAQHLCALIRKSFSIDVQISGSIGMSIWPYDGLDIKSLYEKADIALYHVKATGKDNYAFYSPEMEQERFEHHTETPSAAGNPKKRRMLVVDDNRIDYSLLSNMFKDDFLVEKATDGNAALVRMRYYGSAVSVVLLDLMMPGMDGFSVLEKMRESEELRSIPVIVVSGDEKRETSLKAIRSGASDFVVKPVDPDLLRIRVYSAISKAENERKRAQESVHGFGNSELQCYNTVLGRKGIGIVQHEWIKGTFLYSSAMSAIIAGQFDSRNLWQILLSDMSTDTQTVKRLQELEYGLAHDRSGAEISSSARFKTPSGKLHWFDVNMYTQADEFGMSDKIVLIFTDLGPEKPDN